MSLFALVLPQRCAVCRRPGAGACPRCLDALVRIVPPQCERCGAPGPWPLRRCAECAGRRLAFARARAAVVYEERARAFVAAWKERGRRDLAAVAAQVIVEALPPPAVDVLCPVPGDRDRGLERGHAPAERLAVELAQRWRLPVERLLARRPGVERQRDLPRAERRRNVARAFAPCVQAAPRRVCLVDDVYTTGSTATACATELRRVGARRIEVVCLARALR
ncbi:ComF family protein [Gaiella occulta]|nr:double zinc ribbon domain-containing protein [Gaiella occulta]